MSNKGRPMQPHQHPQYQQGPPPGARPLAQGRKGPRRSTVVTLGAVGTIAALCCGGGAVALFAGDDDTDRYCVDSNDILVDDDDCDDGGGHRWYYVRKGSAKPVKGSKLTGGGYSSKSVPSRGGFGAKGGSGSSGG